MFLRSLLQVVAITPLILLGHNYAAGEASANGLLFDPICKQISRGTSAATSVHYPGDLQYFEDISHWASSSAQRAMCTVRPATAADVGTILRILGSNRTPFAVKGGGHASNPGFSSTAGVLIAMSRFSEVTYGAASETVVVGAGLIWDDVYAALAPHNRNVVGGRVTGVGVAGFILGGGGYSWLTNQYGLTIDTVTAFELVKPDGVIVNVTEASDPDLFFGLKGGYNNFGIVTRFTLRTFPQGRVWGGLTTYLFTKIADVTAATARFSASVTDPKASIISMYNTLFGVPGIFVLMFYDGLEPPEGIFDDFLKIPHLTSDVSSRDFVSLVKAAPANFTYGRRAVFNTVSIENYTPTLLEAIHNETVFWGTRLALKSGFFITCDVEPFLPTILSHASSSSSAYPATRSTRFSPFHLYFAWTLSVFDADFHEAARQSAARIKELAVREGQKVADAPTYPNLAIYDTPLEAMYGTDNVAKLKALKNKVDPENVMGLAGGFKF
ncbi:putative oxygen-dependent FAD-linked oxidoreductase family protein [Lyophyllum shimeji]|uniref:Oxygen-dependent FAD-linked oxidoreductase family protein n=1 Tax=Lyophyllum shimeji TaxID=47721 RepID=A0A9P3UP16_LYOSH|nr:putative oxygen-dependent FAD-linked oxidoreductase family protein [Lyophyllum shimeji]